MNFNYTLAFGVFLLFKGCSFINEHGLQNFSIILILIGVVLITFSPPLIENASDEKKIKDKDDDYLVDIDINCVHCIVTKKSLAIHTIVPYVVQGFQKIKKLKKLSIEALNITIFFIT